MLTKVKIENLKRLTGKWLQRFTSVAGLAALAILAAGCGREDIKVYRVAKETPAQEAQAPSQPAGQGQDQEESPRRLPQWTVPSGWEVRPPASAMHVASFAVTGKDGQTAMVAVTPLPTIVGHEMELVNMWRGQVQLAPVAQEEMGKQGEPVTIGTEKGSVFDMVSEKPVTDSKSLLRITIAMLARGETSWFFKLTGDDALVRKQKPAFLQFLKSINFNATGEPMQFAAAPRPVSTNSKRVPHENSDKPLWTVPSGWQEVPPSQMLAAKFIIPGDNGTKAELNVSQLAGSGGGILPNINRGRNQLGLAPAAEDDLPTQTQSLDVDGGKAMLVDMIGTDPKSGQKMRLIGAVVPQGNQTWFYKLMGNEQVVEREREGFTRFLKTVKYSNAQ